VGFAASGTTVDGNPDVFGGEMVSFTEIMIMDMAFGAVAERAENYLNPRMCDGCF
jgi:hypothetical protein